MAQHHHAFRRQAGRGHLRRPCDQPLQFPRFPVIAGDQHSVAHRQPFGPCQQRCCRLIEQDGMAVMIHHHDGAGQPGEDIQQDILMPLQSGKAILQLSRALQEGQEIGEVAFFVRAERRCGQGTEQGDTSDLPVGQSQNSEQAMEEILGLQPFPVKFGPDHIPVRNDLVSRQRLARPIPIADMQPDIAAGKPCGVVAEPTGGKPDAMADSALVGQKIMIPDRHRRGIEPFYQDIRAAVPRLRPGGCRRNKGGAHVLHRIGDPNPKLCPNNKFIA
jgi:hypothetical protein